jgi:hypothetical protein
MQAIFTECGYLMGLQLDDEALRIRLTLPLFAANRNAAAQLKATSPKLLFRRHS